MEEESLYRITHSRKDQLKHIGFDYRGKIFENTLSNQMFRMSPVFREFLVKLETAVHELYESIKNIKIHANAALDKHERRLI